jgi:hypothetical protein
MHPTSCARCHGPIEASSDAAWSVTAPPALLRRQGWVAFAGGAHVLHLDCLGWAEAEALLGGAGELLPAPAMARSGGGRFARPAAVAG